MKKRIEFTGQIQEVAENTVARRIGPTRYRAIKDLEPHPCFIELCVAEEGESTGRVLGKGAVRKRWSRERVQELAERFKSDSVFRAPDLYDGHDDANARRRAVGKLFEGWEEGGKAYACGLVTEAEMAEAVRRGERDTCSIEAAVEFTADGDVWNVEKILVDEPVAVALASSRVTRPGFAGAAVTRVIQETEKGAEGMTLQEIIAWCKAQNVRPDQVFSNEELLNVGAVRDAVKNETAELEKRLTDANIKIAADLKATQEQLAASRNEGAAMRQRELRMSEDTRSMIEQAPATKDRGALVVPYVRQHLPETVFAEADPAKRKAAIESAAAEIVKRAEEIGLNFVPAPGAGGGTGAPRTVAGGLITAANCMDPNVNDLIPKTAEPKN